ncbi:esterase-like activity of phytase family protein [Dinghuibacter silviterrae]|uniref:Phytase-like domain-containing protein n=1 Tax=Dinghuibacter silviterrae TaxID=1539049 RepID=A0A4R8DXK6_9BACT|nr:esterase-like activity of phytase family protein [Dinghuibacter silviterrae]TDX01951.1 hypothetical protein EDB95_2998 [Dinghuibacter silviterrae]
MRFLLPIFCLLVQTAAAQIDSLHFLGEYDVPYNAPFHGTTIGGLSGIDYDAARKVYYLISDDRSDVNPARFYTAAITISHKGILGIRFTNVTTFLQANGQPYPNAKQDPAHTPDPEALRYNPRLDRMAWSSEGERIVTPGKVVLEDPAVTLITRGGKYVDTMKLPDQLQMRQTPEGPRQNGVFEGVAFADGGRSLYVSVEEPLYQDGPRAGLKDTTTWTRIIKFDLKTRKPVEQYAWKLGPVARPPQPAGAFMINGIPDIMSLGDGKLLLLERSFSSGHMACTIKVFIADVSKASDVSTINSLQATPPKNPVKSRLLLNMDKLGRYVDNIEGVTYGPTLKNGHKTLLFVADNNFNPLQKTQFFLFEVFP